MDDRLNFLPGCLLSFFFPLVCVCVYVCVGHYDHHVLSIVPIFSLCCDFSNSFPFSLFVTCHLTVHILTHTQTLPNPNRRSLKLHPEGEDKCL